MTIEVGDFIKFKNLKDNPLKIDKKKWYLVREVLCFKGKVMFTTEIETLQGNRLLTFPYKNVKEVKKIICID